MDKETFQPWAKTQPNGGVWENCGLTIVNKWDPSKCGEIKWYDVTCSRKFPALCEVPEKEVFILRGKY